MSSVIDKGNLQRFHVNISSRKSNYSSSSELLSFSKSLRISFVQSSIAVIWFLVILIHKFLVPFQHWNILRGRVDFDANSDRNFKATLYERGSAILRINYCYFNVPPPIFSDANLGKTLFVFWPLGQYGPNLNLFQFV